MNYTRLVGKKNMNALYVTQKVVHRRFIVSVILLLVVQRFVIGCFWQENIKPDNVGKIASVSNRTQDDCCQYCLDSFNDTLAAFLSDSICTCLNTFHLIVPFNGSFYTYITRDPITLNQSDYECGRRGAFKVLTLYYVTSQYDGALIKFISMDFNLSLDTSVLMLPPNQNQLNYDDTTVGFSARSSKTSPVNYLYNTTFAFLVGFVNITTQFALSYARIVYVYPAKLIVYIKVFNVVANLKNSRASSFISETYTYAAIKRNVFTSISYIFNDDFNSTADTENVIYVIYFNEKLMSYKECVFYILGTVTNLTTQWFVETNRLKLIIPKLRTGVRFQLIVYFNSLLKEQQKVESLFYELSAMIYQNGTLQQLLTQYNKRYSNVEVHKRVRNRKFVGDMLSILQFNHLLLVCEWAIDRSKNYCGFLSLEEMPTFTRLSSVFVKPICFDNTTQVFFFEDKFGSVFAYNYLNKTRIRLPDTKQKILQLRSIILPLTASKDEKLLCFNTQIGRYNGLPYNISAASFILGNLTIFYWASPAIFISTKF